MNTSGNASPIRPLVMGLIVGLFIGLILGLFWAWMVQPAFYKGGAHPNELSGQYQKTYVQSASEAYFTTRDAGVVSERLAPFSPEQKVKLLAQTVDGYRSTGRDTEADMVSDLSVALAQAENWSPDAISAGLTDADASDAFALKFGQVPQPEGAETQAQTVPKKSGGGSNFWRILLIALIVIVAIVVILYLLTRIKPKIKPRDHATKAAMEQVILDDGSEVQPLRQWTGTYTIGQDNYDESFAIETDESDFLGECGMGIMDGFASGSPKKVLAFDIWLFDKTDIRTISVPVMSKFGFEDDILRAKLPPDSNPILAIEGGGVDIETTALLVKAKIEEVAYGEGQPEMSYFDTLKITLSAYLKPGVDVSAPMPVPEGLS